MKSVNKALVSGMQTLLQTTAGRVALSIGVMAASAASVVAITADGSFNETLTQDTPTIQTGTLDVRFGDESPASDPAEKHSLDVGASLVPGDYMQRIVNIHNVGTVALSSLTVATSAPTVSSALDTDATNGLQLVVDECSVPWSDNGNNTWSCSGTTTQRHATSPVVQPAFSLGTNALATGSVGHYRMTMTLPSSSTISNATSQIRFTFTGTQAAAGAK